MRRALSIARIVAVYLLLGLVATWAVAWGLALLPPGKEFVLAEDPNSKPSRYGVRGIGSSRLHYTPHVLLSGNRIIDPTGIYDGVSIGWADLHDFLDPSWPERWGGELSPERVTWRQTFLDDARGFPFLSHWCSWETKGGRLTANGNYAAQPGSLKGGISLPDHPALNLSTNAKLRALPYMPSWSGLALNTVFYALVFFIAVRLAKGTRHLVRFRCGRCPKCGYDLLGRFDVACSECGHQACRRSAPH